MFNNVYNFVVNSFIYIIMNYIFLCLNYGMLYFVLLIKRLIEQNIFYFKDKCFKVFFRVNFIIMNY